jgi:hypothetical protein
MGEIKPLKTLLDEYVRVAERMTEALSPRWKAQADVAKSLVPIASGALVFTIAFVPSLVKPGVSVVWRYSLVLCWLAFLGALASTLFSLRYSLNLHDYPLMLMEKTREFADVYATIDSETPEQPNPFHAISFEAFHSIRRSERIARRWFDAAFICYGVALSALAAIGVRQLVM